MVIITREAQSSALARWQQHKAVASLCGFQITPVEQQMAKKGQPTHSHTHTQSECVSSGRANLREERQQIVCSLARCQSGFVVLLSLGCIGDFLYYFNQTHADINLFIYIIEFRNFHY